MSADWNGTLTVYSTSLTVTWKMRSDPAPRVRVGLDTVASTPVSALSVKASPIVLYGSASSVYSCLAGSNPGMSMLAFPPFASVRVTVSMLRLLSCARSAVTSIR